MAVVNGIFLAIGTRVFDTVGAVKTTESLDLS
jgi:hypothetical protein